jgi:hypothetical protein
MNFYRRLGEMPPDIHMSSELVNQLFNEEINVDRRILDQQWRAYMRTLKTDIEVILD